MPYHLEHRTTKTITRGAHYPLGATLTPTGVNFALYAQHATEVFLLLFDNADGDPTDIIRLEQRDKFVWHAHVNDVKASQLYGYKVRGEYRPEWGLRFNDAKLLLDPYAKPVTGKFRNTAGIFLDWGFRFWLVWSPNWRSGMTIRRSDWNGQVTLPKGGREQHLPLTKRLATALAEHRHLRSSRVLLQDDGRPLTRQIVQTPVKAAARMK